MGYRRHQVPFWTYIHSVLPRQLHTTEYNRNTQKGRRKGKNKIKSLNMNIIIMIFKCHQTLTLVEDKVLPLGCILSASAATSLISFPAASLSFR
jgi:hypothetical protein